MACWTDTHAHLDADAFRGDLPAVLERARAAGVSRIVCAATSVESAGATMAILGEHGRRGAPEVYGTAGIHAHDCATFGPDSLGRIEEALAGDRFVAVGETGMDFFRDYAPRDLQEAAFRAQAELAARLDIPLIVHCRAAEDAVYRVLAAVVDSRSRRIRGVMHCFASTPAWAEKFRGLGLHISFSAIITYPKSGSVREAAAAVDADGLLIETDCPYLPPQSARGKRNEPALLPETGAKLAEIRGWSVDETAARTSANAAALFGF
ncbi:MAG: TatD family hydrolase [Planctomycetota bacterium]|nr:TatD family hydrolase [Planctomycetota bacterium]